MPKLLLVEDNEVNRDLLTRRLQRRGYEVICASSGAEGVSKTLSNKPELVLMNMNLPGMDGWEATRQLKANPQSQNIPVIALSAYAMAGREQALAAGCDEYDTQPLDLSRLVEKIELLLHKSQQQWHPPDSRMPLLLMLVRQQLCTPLNAIIGYSAMLLEQLQSQGAATAVCSDIEKLLVCGTQMQQLVSVMLNPVQLQMQQLPLQLERVGSSLRWQLLTPLSTVLGYCEMLLEEAAAELLPDLDKINIAAQQLFSMIDDISNLVAQQWQAIDDNALDTPEQIWEAMPNSLTVAATSATGAEVVPIPILVVSHHDDGELLQRQLEPQGYTVATATNAAQARQMLQDMPYELILLDMLMPQSQGWEFLQRQRHEDWCEIPVLVLTTVDALAQVVRYIQLGAQDYLTKPFQPVLLRTKIAACLEHKRLRSQQAAYRRAEQYRQLWENAPLGIYQSTLDGQWLSVNPALARIYGYEPDAMLKAMTAIGTQIYVEPHRREQLRRLVEQQGAVQEFEYQVYRQDGEVIWVAESTCLVTDASGQLCYQGIVQDITQRKLAATAQQRQLEQLQVELDQLQRARQLTQLTQTDYFQQLKAEVANLGDTEHDAPASLGPKVLLVEDNEMNRDMLSRRLQRCGYEVEIAVDGAQGVAKTAAAQPDIVLMDMNLPVLDGWAATKQLKADPQTRHIPIIALTAHAMAGDRETALMAGCDDYDTKPIELPRLLGKIKSLLEQVQSYR